MNLTPLKSIRLASTLALTCALSIIQSVHAISVDEDTPFSTLLEMDISELMNIDVNLATRNQERLFTSPAAIYVITKEDIKRSGLRSIPELLRLVPGLHVGKIDANKWAINSRDVSSQFSASMLVMMDGRSLYTPLFNGTYWHIQDTLLEDIERIEIIRGSGGSAWGANAINGVINIITKSSTSTQGGYTHVGGGQGEMRSELAFRHGVKIDNNTSARFYAKTRHLDHGEYLNNTESNNNGFYPVGEEAFDDGQYAQTGFRIDSNTSADDLLTFQVDYYQATSHDLRKNSLSTISDTNSIEASGVNLLSRWTHHFSEQSTITSQLYLDITDQQDDSFHDHQETIDLDMQHDYRWNNQLTSWGIAARRYSDNSGASNATSAVTPRLSISPGDKTDRLYQLFVQNKSSLLDDKLTITVGSKFEDNDYSGNEYQPSARISWTPDETQTWWLAFSRSVITPTRGGQDLYLDFNDFFASCASVGGTIHPQLGCIIDVSTTDDSTITKSTELGYRKSITKKHLIDLAVYYDKFSGFNSLQRTHNYGIELNTRHELTDDWRLEFWLAQQKAFLINNLNEEIERQSLQTPTMHIRSYWNIFDDWQLDILAYYVDEQHNTSGTTLITDAYTRIDMHIGWRIKSNMNLDIALTNINNEVHAEDREPLTRINTGIRRGIFAKLDYSF